MCGTDLNILTSFVTGVSGTESQSYKGTQKLFTLCYYIYSGFDMII